MQPKEKRTDTTKLKPSLPDKELQMSSDPTTNAPEPLKASNRTYPHFPSSRMPRSGDTIRISPQGWEINPGPDEGKKNSDAN